MRNWKILRILTFNNIGGTNVPRTNSRQVTSHGAMKWSGYVPGFGVLVEYLNELLGSIDGPEVGGRAMGGAECTSRADTRETGDKTTLRDQQCECPTH